MPNCTVTLRAYVFLGFYSLNYAWSAEICLIIWHYGMRDRISCGSGCVSSTSVITNSLQDIVERRVAFSPSFTYDYK